MTLLTLAQQTLQRIMTPKQIKRFEGKTIIGLVGLLGGLAVGADVIVVALAVGTIAGASYGLTVGAIFGATFGLAVGANCQVNFGATAATDQTQARRGVIAQIYQESRQKMFATLQQSTPKLHLLCSHRYH